MHSQKKERLEMFGLYWKSRIWLSFIYSQRQGLQFHTATRCLLGAHASATNSMTEERVESAQGSRSSLLSV